MGENLDPPQVENDPYKNLARLITPAQAAAIEAAIYSVRRSGGFGKITLDIRGGVVKFIVKEIRESV